MKKTKKSVQRLKNLYYNQEFEIICKELEKEIEDKGVEYADKQKRTISVHEDSGYSWGQIEQAYEKGALDFAEPREKRISELEKEIVEIEKVSDYRWEENQQLKQENERLKAQIEKMKCCWNCKHPAKDSTGCCCPFAASCHNKSLWEMDAN